MKIENQPIERIHVDYYYSISNSGIMRLQAHILLTPDLVFTPISAHQFQAKIPSKTFCDITQITPDKFSKHHDLQKDVTIMVSTGISMYVAVLASRLETEAQAKMRIQNEAKAKIEHAKKMEAKRKRDMKTLARLAKEYDLPIEVNSESNDK